MSNNSDITNTKKPWSKSTKVYLISTVVGIIFPPLLLFGCFGFVCKLTKMSVYKVVDIFKNRQKKQIDCFSNNFDLTRKGVINEESGTYLKNTIMKVQAEKNKLICDISFSEKNNVMTVFLYDQTNKEFKKQNILGKKDGNWIIQSEKMTDSELNKMDYLYKDKFVKVVDDISKNVVDQIPDEYKKDPNFESCIDMKKKEDNQQTSNQKARKVLVN